MSISPLVSVIVLNWNGWENTIECLESLYQITYPNYEVILVDNGSQDKSVEKIKEWADGKIPVASKFFRYNPNRKPIRYIELNKKEVDYCKESKEKDIADLQFNKKLIIIKNEKNYGFAEGNNIGIRFALNTLNPAYVLTLNNDTVVSPEFLSELIKVSDKENKIGMVAAKLLFYDAPNIINSVGTLIFKDGSAAHLGGREIDIGQYNKVTETFAPCAAAAIYRAEMLNEIGLFDKDFFAYLEDVDLAWRGRLMGWNCIYAPKAVVYHKHSASSGRYSNFKIFQIERNRIWLLSKNYPLTYIILSPFFTIYRFLCMYIAKSDSNNQIFAYTEKTSLFQIINTVLQAYYVGLIKLPRFIKKRKKTPKIRKSNNSDIEKWFKKFSKPFTEIIYK